jgi:hypothetical protein
MIDLEIFILNLILISFQITVIYLYLFKANSMIE